MTTLDQPVNHIIDLEHVEKTYRGRIRALRGISMRVRAGEVFGLLGPNGAGKSTLVKILMTVIHPSVCRGTMLGDRVGRKRTLTQVGYLPEHHRFPDYLKGRQVLDFYGAMSGVPRKDRRRREAELLDKVGMTRWADTPIKKYSKGMRQRVGLAQALMNDPKLVLLDEPTDGVDPQGRREIRDICSQLRDEGRTVFINSHLLSELEMVCDRVAILVQGLVKQQGTIEELTRDQVYYRIELAEPRERAAMVLGEVVGPRLLAGSAAADVVAPAARRVGATALLTGGEWVAIDDAAVRIGTNDPGVIQPIVRGLVERGAIIKAVSPHRPSLEDLFMQAVTDESTGEQLGPGAADTRKRRKEART